MSRKLMAGFSVGAMLLAIAVGVSTSHKVFGQACDQSCKEVQDTGIYYVDQQLCWRYVSGEMRSCWVCGSGSPGGGYCQIGQAIPCKNLTSYGDIRYQKCLDCVKVCPPPVVRTSYQQMSCGILDEVYNTEPLYKCTTGY